MIRFRIFPGFFAAAAVLFLLPSLSGCGGESSSSPAAASAVSSSSGDWIARTEFSGRILFQSNMDGDNEIYLLTSKKLERLTDNTWQDGYPAWSPDGRRVAFTANPKGYFQIFIMNADGTGKRPLTDAGADDTEPAWWPDGAGIVFTREEKRRFRTRIALHRVNLADGQTRRLIPEWSKSHGIANVSPDGRLVTFTGKRGFGWDAALFETRSRKVSFLDEGGKSCRGRFSPDGSRLAYVSSRADGKGDIWLAAPDGSGKTRLTARDETYDYFPSWSPDGRFVVFNSSREHGHDDDWRLMIVEVATGSVRLLFDSPGSDVFPSWF